MSIYFLDFHVGRILEQVGQILCHSLALCIETVRHLHWVLPHVVVYYPSVLAFLNVIPPCCILNFGKSVNHDTKPERCSYNREHAWYFEYGRSCIYVTDCEIHRCHSQSFIVAGVGTIQAKYSQTMFLEEVDMWTHLELIATVLVEWSNSLSEWIFSHIRASLGLVQHCTTPLK